jgi:WD40 repeat protein
MQTLRIFISSPGDVAEERERARQVVQGLRRRYARHFDLVPVFWEDMPLGLETGFQEGIDLLLSRDRGVDIAVFVLWSRLGSALGGNFQRPDGRPYRSGTERELDLMLQARAAQDGKRPHIIAYARQDEGTFEEALRGTTTTEKEERLRQKKLVESFIQEEFHDSQTGSNVRAYHTYHRPQSFSERLRVHLQDVLDGLTGADIGRPAWEIDDRGPPFLGLESFTFEHSEVFFGREDEVSEARLRLNAAAKRGTAFLLVGGGSGTGKSSLAAAGILPEIVAHETDDSVSKWLHVSFTPAALGGDPALGMARILWNVVPSLAARGEAADFVEALRRDPSLAVKIILLPALKAEATKGGAVRLILLVDQLEEVFTDARFTPEARDQFAAILEALASSAAVWIVATLRGDFYPRLLGCEALVRLKSEGAQLDLVPPGADALRRMIESPALLSGLTYEKTGETTLADRILRDVSGQAELLPLLEDLLRELFEKRSPEGVLTVAAYESLGGIEGSLAKRAESSLAALPADVQLAFPEVLRKLVASGEGPEGTAVRRRAALDSFSPGSPARTLVDKLVDDRLATAAAGDDGTPEVSIAHEAILRVWPRVAAWIQENGEFLRLRDRLTARMKEKAPLTAADPLLPAARAILETRRDSFEPEVAAYVERQVEAIDAERQRRERTRRMVFTGLSGLTVAALITAGAALWQWREADVAKSTAIKAKAAEVKQRAEAEGESTRAKRQLYVANLYKLQTALDGNQRQLAKDFFREALYSFTDAYGEPPTEPIELRTMRQQLDTSLWAKKGDIDVLSPDGSRLVAEATDKAKAVWHTSSEQELAVLEECDPEIFRFIPSPDGTRLLGTSLNGAFLWNASTGEKLATLQDCDIGVTAVFSLDGTLLVTGSLGGKTRLWDASTGKELAVLNGHEAQVKSVAFSPDGTRLATGSDDQTARLWDVTTGKEMAVLKGHEGEVQSVAFSPDGSRLATGSIDSTARLWDAVTGRELVLDRDGNEFSMIVFSPDGSRLAIKPRDGDPSLRDAATTKELAVLIGHDSGVDSITFSPEGSRLATRGGNTACVWDASTGKELAVLKGHEGTVMSVAFSPDGTRLATGSDDNTARLWDASTGKEMAVLKGHESTVTSVAFSPAGTLVATGSKDHTARLWDAADGRELAEMKGGEYDIQTVAFTPDGGRLLTTTFFSTRLWNVATINDFGTFDLSQFSKAIAFSPESERLATIAFDQKARLWDIATGKELAVLDGRHNFGMCVAFSPDGKRLAMGGTYVCLWDTATGKEMAVLKGHDQLITSIAFSPDGTRLATGSDDNTARLWDAATGQELAVLKGHEKQVKSVAFSPDGTRLATGSWDNTARLWNASTGKELAVLKGHESFVWSVAFSPDGTRLATGSWHKTALWDTGTGKELAILEGSSIFAFTPDGRRLATCVSDDVLLWNVASGSEERILKGHESTVLSVAFSPDGSRILTGSLDDTARLWDTATGQQITIIKGHEGGVNNVAFSPDGTRLATADSRVVRLWGMSHAEMFTNRLAAASIQRRIRPTVNEWFAANDLEKAQLSLDAAKATMPASDWHEAATLVLLQAPNVIERTRQERVAFLQARFAPQVDAWFDTITALNFKPVFSQLEALKADLSDEEFASLERMCWERAGQIEISFWTTVRSNTAEGLALYKKVVTEAHDVAGELHDLAWRVEAACAEGVSFSPELLDAAVAAARRGVELRPDWFDVLDTLAHLFARQGHLDEAIAMQRKAVERATDEQRLVVAPFLAELEAKAAAAKAPSAEKADEPATEAAAPAAEEPAPNGGPIAPPTDAATESPIEPAPSAP